MTHSNFIVIEGRLTDDPKAIPLPSGDFCVKFSVANNRSRKDAAGNWTEETSFFRCEAWGYCADKVLHMTCKGSPVVIFGRLKQSRWQDEAGQKRQEVVIVADKVEAIMLPPTKEQVEQELRGGGSVTPEPEQIGREFTDDIPF